MSVSAFHSSIDHTDFAVEYTGNEAFEEIYHLADDPEELRNLALLPENQSLLSELRLKAARELRGTQSGFSGGHFIDFLPHLKNLGE